jgi:hypothetical protein
MQFMIKIFIQLVMIWLSISSALDDLNKKKWRWAAFDITWFIYLVVYFAIYIVKIYGD